MYAITGLHNFMLRHTTFSTAARLLKGDNKYQEQLRDAAIRATEMNQGHQPRELREDIANQL